MMDEDSIAYWLHAAEKHARAQAKSGIPDHHFVQKHLDRARELADLEGKDISSEIKRILAIISEKPPKRLKSSDI